MDVAVAVAVAELEAVCVGSDVKEAATLGVAWADTEADTEAVTEAELDEDAVAVAVAVAVVEEDELAVAVADAVADAVAVSEGAAPTTIRGQQNWSVVEYKPEAKIHP